MALTLSVKKPKNGDRLPGHATLIYGSSDEEKRAWEDELNRQCRTYGLPSKSDLLKALVIIASVNDDVMIQQVERLKNQEQAARMVLDGANETGE